MSSDNYSLGDAFTTFNVEYVKLTNLINDVSTKSEFHSHTIVKIYYQVMNVSSICAMLKKQADSEPNSLLSKIQETEKTILEKFDSIIHPKLLAKYLHQFKK